VREWYDRAWYAPESVRHKPIAVDTISKLSSGDAVVSAKPVSAREVLLARTARSDRHVRSDQRKVDRRAPRGMAGMPRCDVAKAEPILL